MLISSHLQASYTLLLEATTKALNPINGTIHNSQNSPNFSKTCKKSSIDFIYRLITRNLNQSDKDTVKLSGKFLNEMGRYTSCLESGQNMTYYLIQSGVDFLRFNLGLCVPDACNVDDWRLINDAVNEKIWETKDVPGSFMNTSAEYFSLNMTNVPYFVQKKHFFEDNFYAFFIVFMTICVMTVGLTTLYNLFKSSKTQKKIKKSSNQKIPKKSEIFKNPKTSRQSYLKSLNFLDMFDACQTYKSLFKVKMSSKMDITMDLLRITCYWMVMAMSFVFTHTMTSKVFTDNKDLCKF